MDRSVVFVHGTGVREEGFAATLTAVRAGLQSSAPGLEVRGCYWGGEHGVRLRLDGASVPGYRPTGGGKADAQDAELARWAVLYTDPWHELRLLERGPAADPADEDDFLDRMEGYRPSPATADALRAAGLDGHFAHALAALGRAPELRAAAETVDRAGFEHRATVARALVAGTLAAAARDGRLPTTGERRDALLAHVVSDLAAQDRGPLSLVAKVSLAVAAPIATRYAQHHRGAISDGAGPFAGDVLRYQARGRGLREAIARSVRTAPGAAVTLVGHSLGGVACVEMLAVQGPGKVDQLITVGSQAPYLYEIDALSCLPFGTPLPDTFPGRWLNILDARDLLSHPAAQVFGDRVQDLTVDNGQPFAESHSAYWANERVWSAVAAWIG